MLDNLKFDDTQSAEVDRCMEEMDGEFFAVRSSSLEEDGEFTSFAGEYYTELGVTRKRIKEVIIKCFCESYNERVEVYRKKQGYEDKNVSLAIFIQCQVDSEIAGVGFSLNPLNNDYDEVVINANLGLGETVVSGECDPDLFVIDKVKKKIIEKRLGKKNTVKKIEGIGGVKKIEGENKGSSITGTQVRKLLDLIVRVEEFYAKPIDIEWAISGGELYLLQARPITTFHPLHPDMQTKPGQQRRLYLDIGLFDAITTNIPMTALSLSLIDKFFNILFNGFRICDKKHSKVFSCGVRQYFECNSLFRFISPKRLGKMTKGIDSLLSSYFSDVNSKVYCPMKRSVFFLTYRYIVNICRVCVFFLPFMVRHYSRFFQCYCFPNWARKTTLKMIKRFNGRYKSYRKNTNVKKEFLDKGIYKDFKSLTKEIIHGLLPPAKLALMNGLLKVEAIAKKVKDENVKRDYQNVGLGLPGEIVVEMGVRMYSMAEIILKEGVSSKEDLQAQIISKNLSNDFFSQFNAFVRDYGARGPSEMELSSPRYGDSIELLCLQLFSIAEGIKDGKITNPKETQKEHIDNRNKSVASLLKLLSRKEGRQLKRINTFIDVLGGFRDHPKHGIVELLYPFKGRAISAGKIFFEKNRIDSVDDVFHLTIEDIDQGLQNENFNLRDAVGKNKPFYQKAKKQVYQFPYLIDSRGRIIRPKKIRKKGEIQGVGLSVGIARGPAKVLRFPSEKKVNPGDILITYNTDPGWTPLFINAGAIILEIGGVLQHGALVAREYGKPCISGIEDIFHTFKDGQMLEVDGSTGAVKIL